MSKVEFFEAATSAEGDNSQLMITEDVDFVPFQPTKLPSAEWVHSELARQRMRLSNVNNIRSEPAPSYFDGTVFSKDAAFTLMNRTLQYHQDQIEAIDMEMQTNESSIRYLEDRLREKRDTRRYLESSRQTAMLEKNKLNDQIAFQKGSAGKYWIEYPIFQPTESLSSTPPIELCFRHASWKQFIGDPFSSQFRDFLTFYAPAVSFTPSVGLALPSEKTACIVEGSGQSHVCRNVACRFLHEKHPIEHFSLCIQHLLSLLRQIESLSVVVQSFVSATERKMSSVIQQSISIDPSRSVNAIKGIYFDVLKQFLLRGWYKLDFMMLKLEPQRPVSSLLEKFVDSSSSFCTCEGNCEQSSLSPEFLHFLGVLQCSEHVNERQLSRLQTVADSEMAWKEVLRAYDRGAIPNVAGFVWIASKAVELFPSCGYLWCMYVKATFLHSQNSSWQPLVYVVEAAVRAVSAHENVLNFALMVNQSSMQLPTSVAPMVIALALQLLLGEGSSAAREAALRIAMKYSTPGESALNCTTTYNLGILRLFLIISGNGVDLPAGIPECLAFHLSTVPLSLEFKKSYGIHPAVQKQLDTMLKQMGTWIENCVTEIGSKELHSISSAFSFTKSSFQQASIDVTIAEKLLQLQTAMERDAIDVPELWLYVIDELLGSFGDEDLARIMGEKFCARLSECATEAPWLLLHLSNIFASHMLLDLSDSTNRILFEKLRILYVTGNDCTALSVVNVLLKQKPSNIPVETYGATCLTVAYQLRKEKKNALAFKLLQHASEEKRLSAEHRCIVLLELQKECLSCAPVDVELVCSYLQKQLKELSTPLGSLLCIRTMSFPKITFDDFLRSTLRQSVEEISLQLSATSFAAFRQKLLK